MAQRTAKNVFTGLVFGYDLGYPEALNIVEVTSDLGYLKTSWFDEEESAFDTTIGVHDAIDLFVLRLYTSTLKKNQIALGVTNADRAARVREIFGVWFVPYGDAHTPKYAIVADEMLASPCTAHVVDVLNVARGHNNTAKRLNKALSVLEITPLQNGAAWLLLGGAQ